MRTSAPLIHPQPVEIDPAGGGPSLLVAAVPAHREPSGLAGSFDQQRHGLAEQIEDPQLDLARLRQLEADQGPAVEGVGRVLLQGKGAGEGRLDVFHRRIVYFLKGLGYLAAENVPTHQGVDLVAKIALVVDDGEALVPQAIVGRHSAGVEEEGHGNPPAGAPERPHLFFGAVPYVGPHGDERLVGKVLPDLLESLGTRETRTSAVSQEEDQHHLAAEIAEGRLAPVEAVQQEVRGRLAYLRHLGVQGRSPQHPQARQKH